ncbi:hypothetical protein NQZ68_033597 [Dissostichus eleginoides]|nr:hypothetical protein NQZ68_033597 [Dissostichus eleginoides]
MSQWKSHHAEKKTEEMEREPLMERLENPSEQWQKTEILTDCQSAIRVCFYSDDQKEVVREGSMDDSL